MNDATVRRLEPTDDIGPIVELIVDHAAFEHRTVDPAALAGRLHHWLFERDAATCFVGTVGGEIVAYATAVTEFSTWLPGEFTHLDTLYVHADHRGSGLGRRLLDAVIDHATALGHPHVEWQTPDWNTDAVRFYERVGPKVMAKTRFKLTIEPT